VSKLIERQPDSKRGGRSITILAVADIAKLARRAPSTRLYFELIEDLVARDKQGFDRYGQNLETYDGRKTLADLYQEIVDAIQYARKDIEEQGEAGPIVPIYGTLIQAALTILEEEERRNDQRSATE
jgi:hypothetical protein